MTSTERYLVHQIHPLKLLTDFTTSFASTWFLWERALWPALVVSFPPSIIVSILLLTRADLTRYRTTPLGCYVVSFMTRKVEAIRLGGQVVMWTGAAAHVP